MTSKHILIVDDSPTERHVLAELLTTHGYQVSTASDGDTAIAHIRQNPPHLVLMDVVMPGQNGFQATRAITRDPATKDLPVILCTGKSQDTDRIWGLRQGARDYLVKPINSQLLLEKIASLLYAPV